VSRVIDERPMFIRVDEFEVTGAQADRRTARS